MVYLRRNGYERKNNGVKAHKDEMCDNTVTSVWCT